MKPSKAELKIIVEDMAKLYEHTDIIKTKTGKTLVDIKFNITEQEVDGILSKRIEEILQKYQIQYEQEGMKDLANKMKKDAINKINEYRQEKGIKDFESQEDREK